jgi:polyvinyl alcohol dehydrogenase (cytochrome)
MNRNRFVVIAAAGLAVVACGSKGSTSNPSNSADGASVASLVVPAVPQPDCSADAGDWPMFGHNVCNTSSPLFASGITRANVGKLKTKWIYDAAGDVSATPAVVGGYLYVPDWGGMINKIDATNGHKVWSVAVGDLMAKGGDAGSHLPGFLSRNTPLVTGGLVIFGTMRNTSNLFSTLGTGAYLVAIDEGTGELKWITQADPHPAASVTGSPVLDGGRLYVGVASLEEVFGTAVAGYQCCSFRGSVLAVDAATGGVVWRSHTISDDVYYANAGAGGGAGDAGSGDGGDAGAATAAEVGALAGYAGASVWSSTPVVDRKRQQLYITTGNNYTLPDGGPGTMPGNNVDAIVALDLATGAVKWAQSLPEGGEDVWTFTNLSGPDSDFGCGANLFTTTIGGKPQDIVGAGQKSGTYFALDPSTGNVIWKTQVGPSGHLGGIHWGTAADGNHIYVGVNNENGASIVLGGHGPQAGKDTKSGTWAALDPATGDILWQIADPALAMPLSGASVNGPIVAVNGVMFAGSMDAAGTMFAFDTETGNVLWSFKSGATVYGSPAVVGGTVYWGAGYPSRLGFGNSIQKLYAFSVN